ncbi:hypothetical protein JW824_13540 [bacterium]|nr:hypothetical protein [bacterium]
MEGRLLQGRPLTLTKSLPWILNQVQHRLDPGRGVFLPLKLVPYLIREEILGSDTDPR